MVPRGNTVSRSDLSDLCFVDDLVSQLIFWRKSQLSRFAEMVSQVLESGRLRVIKSKLEVLVAAAGPGTRRINAETGNLWRALVRSILMFAAEALAWIPKDVETLEKYQNRAIRRCSCVSRAHARPPREAWSTHCSVNAASAEVILGKEMAVRRNISRR